MPALRSSRIGNGNGGRKGARVGDGEGNLNGWAERDQTARPHVFVVNNAPEVLDLMRELLQDDNYNVTTTTFAPETFDRIATFQPSLLMIDLAAGERDGWDLLERVHGEAATNDIPVVVTSTDPGLLEDAKAQQDRYGGQRFLAKPYDIDEVMGDVRDLIGPG